MRFSYGESRQCLRAVCGDLGPALSAARMTRALDERLRIVVWEAVFGTADAQWAHAKAQELLAAGARWSRTEEEVQYGRDNG